MKIERFGCLHKRHILFSVLICSTILGAFYFLLRPYSWSQVSAYLSYKDRRQPAPIQIRSHETIRILCWIMTQPVNHATKAKAVKATWGKRCTKLIFISSERDESLPSVALNVSEGRRNLWAKTFGAFTYIFRHHFNEADWFVKADDDTYMLIENLKAFLNSYTPSQPIYFGCKFKPYVRQGYMSGGAGYVLSAEALRRFAVEVLQSQNSSSCRNRDFEGAEDVEMGKCLEAVGVQAGDSRDKLGKHRFMPFELSYFYSDQVKSSNFWYRKYLFYPQLFDSDCCSDTAISFHYLSPKSMYQMDYLLYSLRQSPSCPSKD